MKAYIYDKNISGDYTYTLLMSYKFLVLMKIHASVIHLLSKNNFLISDKGTLILIYHQINL